ALSIEAVPETPLTLAPRLAWDQSNGRLYLTYEDLTDDPDGAAAGDVDIFFSVSVDGGSNWHEPVTVGTDSGAHSQFLPTITVDPTTGVLALGWYDTEIGAGNVSTQF